MSRPSVWLIAKRVRETGRFEILDALESCRYSELARKNGQVYAPELLFAKPIPFIVDPKATGKLFKRGNCEGRYVRLMLCGSNPLSEVQHAARHHPCAARKRTAAQQAPSEDRRRSAHRPLLAASHGS